MGWTVSLGKQMGWGLLGCGAWRTPLHVAPSGDTLTGQPGGEMLQMLQGVRHPRGFRCRDAPKALSAETPQKFWL